MGRDALGMFLWAVLGVLGSSFPSRPENGPTREALPVGCWAPASQVHLVIGRLFRRFLVVRDRGTIREALPVTSAGLGFEAIGLSL